MNNSNTASNWPEIPIGKTGQVLGGRQRSPHATGSPQKYLRVANVFDGYIDSSDVFEMPFSEEESKRFLLAPGDILLNEGQSLELVGRSAVYRGDPPDCCFQNTLIRYRANSDVLPEFAQYTFQNFLRLGKFAAIASQTTSIAHLGTGRFAALPMPVPPLDEQRAIASALSDMDALLAKLDQLIAKKRDIKQAAMQELLTGRRRLPGFSGEWQKINLGKLGKFLKGRGIKKDEVISEGLPCIRYGEIYTTHNDFIRRFRSYISPETASESQRIQQGDLLFAASGETSEDIGKCVVYTQSEEAYAGGDIVILINHRQDPIYMGYLMNQKEVVDQKSKMGQGDAVVHISATSLSAVEVRLPPLAEQEAMSEMFNDMDTEITALEACREKTRLIKQGMMQELLSGRVRLI